MLSETTTHPVQFMIQFRRQWPAATAIIAGLAFILNHYRIAGLENVQLVRRTPAEIAEREASETWSTSLLSDLKSASISGAGQCPCWYERRSSCTFSRQLRFELEFSLPEQ